MNSCRAFIVILSLSFFRGYTLENHFEQHSIIQEQAIEEDIVLLADTHLPQHKEQIFIDRLTQEEAKDHFDLNNEIGKLCIDLGPGKTFENIHIEHFNLEDRLEKKFKKKHKEFQPTKIYCINDFIDPDTHDHYHFKPFPPGKEIVFICGMGSTINDFKKSLLHLTHLSGGYNVVGVYSPTYGLDIDLYCYFQTVNGAAFEGARDIKRLIKKFDKQNHSTDTLLLIPHSRGCGDTRNALIDSSKDLRRRVEVLAVAPGVFIDPRLCNKIFHYISLRDPTPLLDILGGLRSSSSIIPLDPHPKAPRLDHFFTSPTYAKHLQNEINKYLEN